MKSLQTLFIAALLAIAFFSCEEKMVVIPDFVPPVSDRVILMEEFTGAACANCPAGSAQVENLLDLFGDNLVAIGVHSEFLAFPIKTGDKDLRTPEAEEIEVFLGGWRSKPEAAFNRKQFSGEQNIRVSARPDEWVTFISEELESFARVLIDTDVQYDNSTRTATFNVTAEAQEFLKGDFRINVFITESGIITAQLDGGSVIDPYEHKHALRAALTEIAGDAFFTSLDPGVTRERSFSFTFPDEDGWWIPENSEIVVFISNGATKEVLQAHSAHVVE